ncbi:hypothetical protein J5N97_018952 [Dioscorea zingiberensis]|uniref:Uncharacterized protein n=1 Tax=Dioscorea zingiberensis TaxID=325984 RepID=A0A9D5CD25_9LILI|nr:hypothetical protein J5N97_018952 [Dioscorea zingiberensis]
MPKSSSPSPTVTPMTPPTLVKPHNPQSQPQTLTLNPHPSSDLDPLLHPFPHSLLLMDEDDDPDPHPPPSASSFSSLIFRDDDDDDDDVDDELKVDLKQSPSSPLADDPDPDPTPAPEKQQQQRPPPPLVDPTPHVSSQFYTFNRESHGLMVRCILEGRLATPDEIRAATPRPVLNSWRSVWKDRNEDTAYLTAWKRIQDKLHAGAGGGLYFKNNPAQCVSHVDQWQDIVAASHADADLRHLGLKETVDRIKQSWTVGAKFYGIPESFIRVCLAACPVCSSPSPTSGAGTHLALAGSRSKRRRFEYTESFDVPARDVPRRLQQLAAKHQVVLCIRQKYIRYKPFMAEVKDYACHRAGEPSSATGSSSKKARVLKREPYASKRCGCGFRIRAIVPITNYNEKDKTFVYQEEGTAVFKLFAVHSGHEPGPLDGNARIIHRLVGNKGGFDQDPEIYGISEDAEPESFVGLLGKDDGGDPHLAVLQQVQEIRVEAGLLEGRISKMPQELLASLSGELLDILHRLRSVGAQQHSDEPLVVGDDEVQHWTADHNHHLDGQDSVFSKGNGIIEEDESDFDRALGAIVPWDRMAAECQDRKMLMSETCKSEKWLMKEDCSDFDEKSILNCGEVEEVDSKLIKPLRHGGSMVPDTNLVGIQVDGFYHDNTKWYDSPGGLDPGGDAGDGGFRHGRIV